MLKEKAIATLTIHNAAEFSDMGKKEIADWLRHHAKQLVRKNKEYSKRFTGKFMVLKNE